MHYPHQYMSDTPPISGLRVPTYGSSTPTLSTPPPRVSNYVNKGSIEAGAPKCNDCGFAVLFFCMLSAFFATSLAFIPELHASSSTTSHYYSSSSGGGGPRWRGWVALALLESTIAVALSLVSISFMIANAETLISGCLIASVVVSAFCAVSAMVMGMLVGGIVLMLFAMLTAWYACIAWSRIPFATANMKTGLTAVSENLGLMLVALSALAVGLVWILWWTVNLLAISIHMGALNVNNEVEESADDSTDANPGKQLDGGVLFVLLVCLYWGVQVVSNVLHVTVAGVVGTWWFRPSEAQRFCSNAVTSSLYRATTSSFGSICLGSLVVAFIQAARAILSNMRQNEDGGLIACCAECLLSCIESIARYFNKWALVYCGIYGYSFVPAGKRVIALFEDRGLAAMIADDLVSNVMSFFSFGIGGLTGLGGIVAFELFPSILGGRSGTNVTVVFFAGLGLGLVFSTLLFGVLVSAVDSVIVLFAEAPEDFRNNHPSRYDAMAEGWWKAYPHFFVAAVEVPSHDDGGERGGGGGGGARTSNALRNSGFGDAGGGKRYEPNSLW